MCIVVLPYLCAQTTNTNTRKSISFKTNSYYGKENHSYLYAYLLLQQYNG